MDNNLESSARHAIQTILSQIVDVNNHVRTQQEKEDLSEADKNVTINFGNYHLMVLAILLHEFKDLAYAKFPDAKNILDWAESHYKFGLENNSFKLCQCQECKDIQAEKDKIAENDKKILEA